MIAFKQYSRKYKYKICNRIKIKIKFVPQEKIRFYQQQMAGDININYDSEEGRYKNVI